MGASRASLPTSEALARSKEGKHHCCCTGRTSSHFPFSAPVLHHQPIVLVDTAFHDPFPLIHCKRSFCRWNLWLKQQPGNSGVLPRKSSGRFTFLQLCSVQRWYGTGSINRQAFWQKENFHPENPLKKGPLRCWSLDCVPLQCSSICPNFTCWMQLHSSYRLTTFCQLISGPRVVLS